jgi:peptide/nickel transport system permease protein
MAIGSLLEVIRIIIGNRASLAGFLMLLVFVSMAILADLIAPYNPYERVSLPFQPPSGRHWLGTDDLGRDIFSQMIYSSRLSLIIGFISALVATVIGTMLGILSGYYGGKVDEILMRLTDLWLAFPNLLFAILLVVIFSPQTGNRVVPIIIAIALVSWPTASRLIRSAVISIKQSPYIEAARALGASDARIIFSHILPNTTSLIIIEVITIMGGAMLTEASLSFLGLGDPRAMSWGMMLHYALSRNAIYLGMWWWFLPPGLLISLSVLSIILISTGLEEYFNPRLRRRL